MFIAKFANFVETPFSQSTTGRLLLLVAVSIVVMGELANKTVNYEKGQSKWKNRFRKQSFADFKLGVLKNFVSFTRKHLWKVCNSIKKGLQRSRFLWNLQNSFSGYFWGLTCFQRSPEQKPLRLSAINIISSCKNVFTATKIQKQSP